ncbi:MAG: DUF5694 domain-containing protein [Pseudomonadota bacterium]
MIGKGFLLRCTTLTTLLALASPALAADEPPAQVLLIGLFHFHNPGQDVVKTDVLDVMTDENQAYLQALSQRIAALKPTSVLLEYDPAMQQEMQAEYEGYRAGSFELTHNEIYQLGFRVAALANLKEVHPFDEREVGWEAEELFKRIESDPETKARLDALIAEITEETNRKQATLPLAELLHDHNSPAEDQRNRSFYLLTNHLGAGEDFVGADAAASWWHRNFRMYANVQRHATPGSRVVVIGGQGHIAILRGLLADDPDRQPIDVMPLL